jgi:hypothetical protein
VRAQQAAAAIDQFNNRALYRELFEDTPEVQLDCIQNILRTGGLCGHETDNEPPSMVCPISSSATTVDAVSAHDIALEELPLGMTLLHHAIVANNQVAFTALMALRRGTPLNSRNSFIRWRRRLQELRVPSILHTAVFHDRKDMVATLLEAGCCVNSSDCPHQFSPLHLSVRWRDCHVMRLLLESGANPHAQNDFGIAPLHLACKYGNATAVSLLLNAGCNPNITDSLNRCPITFAIFGKQWVASGVNLSAGRPDMQRVQFDEEVRQRASCSDYADIVYALARSGAHIPCHCCDPFGSINEPYLGEQPATWGQMMRSCWLHVSHSDPLPPPPQTDIPLLHCVRSGSFELVEALLLCTDPLHHNHTPRSSSRCPQPLSTIARDIYMHEFFAHYRVRGPNVPALDPVNHPFSPRVGDPGVITMEDGALAMQLIEIRRKLHPYDRIAKLLLQHGEDPWFGDVYMQHKSPMEQLAPLLSVSPRIRRMCAEWRSESAWHRRRHAVAGWKEANKEYM